MGLDDADKQKIHVMIQNSRGLAGGFNVPDVVFVDLVKKQMGFTKLPCMACARDVLEEMQLMQRDALAQVTSATVAPPHRQNKK